MPGLACPDGFRDDGVGRGALRLEAFGHQRCVRSGMAAELVQHGGDVHFDGVFGEVQLVRNLFVEQTVRDAHEDTHLLRCELRELCGELRIIIAPGRIVLGEAGLAGHHASDRGEHVGERC